MTKEELKLKAEESFEQYKVTDEDYVVSPYSDDMGEKMLMFNYEYEVEETYLRLYTQGYLAGAETREKRIAELEKENAELKSIAEFQQSSNMSRHFENKKLKEGLAVGSMWNKHLNSQNKALEEERDKYRNMVFDKDEQLTKAKEIIKELVRVEYADFTNGDYSNELSKVLEQAEQFLSEVEK